MIARINAVLDKGHILSGAQLKWIAMISMLIDHFNKGVFYSLLLVKGVNHPALVLCSNVMDVLGRIAFPIFLFLLVEGFYHTGSRKKYLLYLLGFGVIAEVPYDMFIAGQFWDTGGQNMYFTLALALVTLCIIHWLREKKVRLWWLAGIVITAVCSYISSLLGLDYGFYGILIPVIFYVLYQYRRVGSLVNYAVILKESWSILGFVTVNLYNGERGTINKWFCYWFYPLHLLGIGLIRMYVLHV